MHKFIQRSLCAHSLPLRWFLFIAGFMNTALQHHFRTLKGARKRVGMIRILTVIGLPVGQNPVGIASFRPSFGRQRFQPFDGGQGRVLLREQPRVPHIVLGQRNHHVPAPRIYQGVDIAVAQDHGIFQHIVKPLLPDIGPLQGRWKRNGAAVRVGG
ncbi:MAG: hypothetical protein BWX80_01842 [Candidatus Hydrogenedentes bacterium ADurb.Bin101]|nr:MAG: hypothetical protein BWX80_01842 [Candidatus Hydrogenedentes bacterium ADurb.Bin101]